VVVRDGVPTLLLRDGVEVVRDGATDEPRELPVVVTLEGIVDVPREVPVELCLEGVVPTRDEDDDVLPASLTVTRELPANELRPATRLPPASLDPR
jgi:hypothetical protein